MASIAMLNYQRVPSAVSWRFPTQTTWFPGISSLFFMDFIAFPPKRSPELRCHHCHGWEIPELMEVCENCRRLQQFLIFRKGWTTGVQKQVQACDLFRRVPLLEGGIPIAYENSPPHLAAIQHIARMMTFISLSVTHTFKLKVKSRVLIPMIDV